MTWHRMTARLPLFCGSCRQAIRAPKAEDGIVEYAKVSTARLIRCRSCAEDVQGWCRWPVAPYVAGAGETPVTWVPNATQPFAPLRRQVTDFKAQQIKDADV